jgi:hypothetical protein
VFQPPKTTTRNSYCCEPFNADKDREEHMGRSGGHAQPHPCGRTDERTRRPVEARNSPGERLHCANRSETLTSVLKFRLSDFLEHMAT